MQTPLWAHHPQVNKAALEEVLQPIQPSKSAWQRKNDETTKTVEATKELNALMKKTIQQAVRQEVKSYKKKGGSDLNMVEALLGNFNYSDMDNMHIDSDDDRKIPADLTIDSDEEVSV